MMKKVNELLKGKNADDIIQILWELDKQDCDISIFMAVYERLENLDEKKAIEFANSYVYDM